MHKQFFKNIFVNETRKLIYLGKQPVFTSSFFRCETFSGSSTAGFIKQKIKLVWPNPIFLCFAQKSCSCPCSSEMQIFFLIFNLFVLTLSPVSSFLSFSINNRADQKFFEDSFFSFSGSSRKQHIRYCVRKSLHLLKSK